MDPIVWIVLGILVLLVIIGVVVSRSRKQREASRRAEAEQLRASAAEHDRDLREREAEAAAADAQARRARAEADERAAHAERLTVEAERRDEHRVEAQRVRDEELRRADALDPDVPTDKHGNRLDDDTELADPYGGRGETRHSDPREDHPDRHNTRIVGAPVDGEHHPNGDRPHDERLDHDGTDPARHGLAHGDRHDNGAHHGDLHDREAHGEGMRDHDGRHDGRHDHDRHDQDAHGEGPHGRDGRQEHVGDGVHERSRDGRLHDGQVHDERTHDGLDRDGSRREGAILGDEQHRAASGEQRGSAADRSDGAPIDGLRGDGPRADGARSDAIDRHEASSDEHTGGRRADGSVLDKSHLDDPQDPARGRDDQLAREHAPEDGDVVDDGSDHPSAADRDHRRRIDGPDIDRTQR